MSLQTGIITALYEWESGCDYQPLNSLSPSLSLTILEPSLTLLAQPFSNFNVSQAT